jgi:antitoxin VapB
MEVIQEMGLNLKNQEVERLAAEVAALVGETKTEAIRRALEERKQRLSFQMTHRDRKARLKSLLETEIWPLIPKKLLGKRLTRKEHDRILGYGQGGI